MNEAKERLVHQKNEEKFLMEKSVLYTNNIWGWIELRDVLYNNKKSAKILKE